MEPEAMDLSLVSTDELLGEVMKRYDAAGFVGLMKDVKGEDTSSTHRFWEGDEHTVIGLCADLQYALLTDFTMRKVGDTWERDTWERDAEGHAEGRDVDGK